MLNKQICKRCINKHRQEGYEFKWDDYDDYKWNEGYIFCPYYDEYYETDINKNPPIKCPYSLEHIIENQ